MFRNSKQEVTFVQEYWLCLNNDTGHLTTDYFEKINCHPSLQIICSIKVSTVPDDKKAPEITSACARVYTCILDTYKLNN